MTNGTVWHQRDNRSSLFEQHKGSWLRDGFRALIKMSSKSGNQEDVGELRFHSGGDFRVTLTLCVAPDTPWARMSWDSTDTHYSSDKQVWTFWTQTQNNPVSSPPLFTLPDLFVIGKCLSLRLYLRVSVCLTLVWLGRVSPWSHQSAWGPVKAISPSCSVNLCQLCACVSS